jgi:GNAT superfamily N-acetyltransferase
MNIEIKEIDEDNFDKFFEILKKHVTYARYDASYLTKFKNSEMRKEVFSQKSNFEIHLACIDNDVAAFIIFKKEYSIFSARPQIFLMHLFVDEEYRGQGVGQKLFDFCKSKAKESSCEAMEWLVLAKNGPAMKFYEKNNAKKEVECFFYELTDL